MPDQLEDLGDWLETLPKNTGIFCGDDSHGQRVLEAAQARRLEVPGEIAVLLLEHDLPSVGSARELADQLHTSHTTLNLQFRAATGQSTWCFVKKRRMEKALELLRNTDLVLAEICAETGISTLSQLSTYIRKATGKSPREIRASTGSSS